MNARLTRRSVSIGLAVGVAGCLDELNGDDDGNGDGEDERNADNPALSDATQEGELRLTSPAFDDGAEIPREYGYDEANVNPPLEIDDVPDDADSLALVVDDPDAVEPSGQIWVHWLVWNAPPETTSIPERWDSDDAVEGTNDFDEVGYDGPRPPDEEHTYRFKLYALDTVLDLEEGATVDDLGAAMNGHVFAQTQLSGTYAP
jgi:Raf kinase inhibitor-like YbhB/YbcL family protein